MALELTDDNFESLVLQSEKTVLVDFWAIWCGPCKVLSPIIDELSNEYEGKAVIGKVNVDANPEITSKFGVRNIPTVFIFKDGKIVDKQVGVGTKATYASKLDAQL